MPKYSLEEIKTWLNTQSPIHNPTGNPTTEQILGALGGRCAEVFESDPPLAVKFAEEFHCMVSPAASKDVFQQFIDVAKR